MQQNMMYVSEDLLREKDEQIMKLWGIIHLQRQEYMDLKETNAFQSSLIAKYKELAAASLAREARRSGHT